MCVLYYCHRVATQLQLNISYRIMSYAIYHITGQQVAQIHDRYMMMMMMIYHITVSLLIVS